MGDVHRVKNNLFAFLCHVHFICFRLYSCYSIDVACYGLALTLTQIGTVFVMAAQKGTVFVMAAQKGTVFVSRIRVL